MKKDYDYSYFRKVAALGEHLYEIDEDTFLQFSDLIDELQNAGFTPRRTLEYIAEKIF